MCHVTAPLLAVHIMLCTSHCCPFVSTSATSPPFSQLHRQYRHTSPSCVCHVPTPLMGTSATSPCPSQLCLPHHCPFHSHMGHITGPCPHPSHKHTCYITAPFLAVRTISPPSPHHTGHVAACLAAAPTTLLPLSQHWHPGPWSVAYVEILYQFK